MSQHKHTDGTDMISERPDDNKEVVESSTAPAEALRQQLSIYMDIYARGKENVDVSAMTAALDHAERLVTAYAATVEREATIKELKAVTKQARENGGTLWYYHIDDRLAALQGPIQGDSNTSEEASSAQ